MAQALPVTFTEALNVSGLSLVPADACKKSPYVPRSTEFYQRSENLRASAVIGSDPNVHHGDGSLSQWSFGYLCGRIHGAELLGP